MENNNRNYAKFIMLIKLYQKNDIYENIKLKEKGVII